MEVTIELTVKVVRQLAERIAKVPARKIVLHGTIGKDFRLESNCGHSWWSGSEECVETIYGFNPECGFKKLEIKP